MTDDVKQLKEIVVKGFDDNNEKHKELEKLLFKGNGKASLLSRVDANEKGLRSLSKSVMQANTELLSAVRGFEIYMQETSDFVKNAKEEIKEIKEDTKDNSRHRVITEAQMGVWKWLAGFLGAGNLAAILYNLTIK